MAFTNLNRHFPDVPAFAAWLATLPKPTWGVRASTYHNTYIPNESQWRGHASMLSMQATYIKNGWTTGPHVYLAHGTSADGIFVMCPPTMEAIHGVVCNTDHFGLEVVGDFDARPMSAGQLDLLVQTMAALHRWAGIGPNVNAHRDCVPRTCPGDEAYKQKAVVQQRLATALAPVNPLDPFAGWGAIGKPSNVQEGWAIPQKWLLNQKLGRCVVAEDYPASTMSLAVFERGFIWYNVAKKAAMVELF